MCYDCNVELSQRRVAEIRRQRWNEEQAKYEFVAVYGKTTLTAASFVEIGDLLVAKGFLMAEATAIAPLTLRVPHKNQKREPAAVRKVEK